MALRRFAAALSMVAMLSSCGGGGGSSSGGSSAGAGGSGGATASGPCSLRARQDWAEQQLREWYLFPEALPASLSPNNYATVDDYIDALTATARAERKDRYFTYLASIKEEDAYYASGSTAGFGFRLSADGVARRAFISEAFEGAPALAAGIDRGTEIVAVGTSAANLRSVSSIIAAEGPGGVTAALGPSDPGVSRTLRIADAGGTRDVTIVKADYTLTPVSSRYGAKIIEEDGRKIGYLNLRTFIGPAEAPLRDAFASFREQGVTELIVDFRYNGGGLVSIAELMGDLMGGNRSTADVFSYTTFRASKSAENEVRQFSPRPQSVSPMRIAFIGTDATASASELVINSFVPFFRDRAALIGGNTYGKPVGQIALDKSECDDRLRVVAFAKQNADRQGDYYSGLAGKVSVTCQAADDAAYPLGDPRERSTRAALDFLAGRACTPIGASVGVASARGAGRLLLLTPDRPTTAQREVPGLF